MTGMSGGSGDGPGRPNNHTCATLTTIRTTDSHWMDLNRALDMDVRNFQFFFCINDLFDKYMKICVAKSEVI